MVCIDAKTGRVFSSLTKNSIDKFHETVELEDEAIEVGKKSENRDVTEGINLNLAIYYMNSRSLTGPLRVPNCGTCSSYPCKSGIFLPDEVNIMRRAKTLCSVSALVFLIGAAEV